MPFRFLNSPSQDNTGRVATYLQQEVAFDPMTGVVKLTPTAQHNLIEVTGINDNINLDVNFEGKEGDSLTIVLYATTTVVCSTHGLIFRVNDDFTGLTSSKTIIEAIYLGEKTEAPFKGWCITNIAKFNAFA